MQQVVMRYHSIAPLNENINICSTFLQYLIFFIYPLMRPSGWVRHLFFNSCSGLLYYRSHQDSSKRTISSECLPNTYDIHFLIIVWTREQKTKKTRLQFSKQVIAFFLQCIKCAPRVGISFLGILRQDVVVLESTGKHTPRISLLLCLHYTFMNIIMMPSCSQYIVHRIRWIKRQKSEICLFFFLFRGFDLY